MVSSVINGCRRSAGPRDHQGIFRGWGFDDTVAVVVPESLGEQQLIGFIEIVHVQADGGYVPLKRYIRLGNVHIKAVRVLHPNTFHVQFADAFLIVAFSKPNSSNS